MALYLACAVAVVGTSPESTLRLFDLPIVVYVLLLLAKALHSVASLLSRVGDLPCILVVAVVGLVLVSVRAQRLRRPNAFKLVVSHCVPLLTLVIYWLLYRGTSDLVPRGLHWSGAFIPSEVD